MRTILRLLIGSLIGLALSSTAAIAVAASGKLELDPAFGSGGASIAGSVGTDRNVFIGQSATRPGGGIVSVGFVDGGTEDYQSDWRWEIEAFKADGSIDKKFAGDGQLSRVNPGGYASMAGSVASAVAVQPDGKILVAGIVDVATAKDQERYEEVVGGGIDCQCSAARGAFLVARFLPSGAADKSFGKNGHVLLRGITRSWTENVPPSTLDQLVIGPRGRIYVVGSTEYFTFGVLAKDVDRSRLIAFALRENGKRDRRFGKNGKLVAAVGARHRDFKPLRYVARGKGGLIGVGWTVPKFGGGLGELRLASVRVTGKGRLDRSFNRRGWREVGFDGAKFEAIDADIASNGTAVVSLQRVRGSSFENATAAAAVLAKLSSSGILARNFGDGGVVDLNPNRRPLYRTAGPVAIRPDGSVVVATGDDRYVPLAFRVTRISRSGEIGAPLDLNFDILGRSAEWNAVAVSDLVADGRTVNVAGIVSLADRGRGFVARLLSPQV